jgi:hypothetical protein
MNANTILAFRGGTGRNQIAPIVGTAGDITTATVARVYTDTLGTTSVAALAIPTQAAIIGSSNPLSINTNGAILGPAYGRLFGTPRGSQAPYFNTSSFDGVPFRLRVSGTITSAGVAGQTALIQLCLGSSATIGTNVIIASTGAALACVAAGSLNFGIVAEILWDSVLQKVTGRQSSVISFSAPTTQVQSDVVLANIATATAANIAALTFTVFATMGQTAVTSVQVKEFALEAI